MAGIVPRSDVPAFKGIDPSALPSLHESVERRADRRIEPPLSEDRHLQIVPSECQTPGALRISRAGAG